MKSKKFTIAAIGDIHVRERDSGRYYKLFAELSGKANAIALCGDLTNNGLLSEAECLAKEVEAATVPIMAVLGNHDHQGGETVALQKILTSAGINFLENETYEIDDVEFVGIKGFAGGFGQHMVAPFGEGILKLFVDESMRESLILENSLHEVSANRMVVVMHYSPIAETLKGESLEVYPFLGCSRYEEVIDRFPVEVVVHGHAHRGSPYGKTRSGIPVYNCAKDLLLRMNPNQPYRLIDIE